MLCWTAARPSTRAPSIIDATFPDQRGRLRVADGDRNGKRRIDIGAFERAFNEFFNI
jgi:hypothetical protein